MAKLSPVFNDQAVDANGNPRSGAKLFTYVAGSAIKVATFTDAAGLVPQTNPIILNADGYPTLGPIWIAEGTMVKFVLAPSTDTDPPTSPIKTIDNVAGVNDSSTSISQWTASGVTPTYISASSFSLPGDQTTAFEPSRRLQFITSIGTVYGTILTSVFTALTTVTVQMDGAQVLDLGLTVVNLGVLTASNSSIPTTIARIASPTFTGDPKGPTPLSGDNDTSLPTTAFVQGQAVPVPQTVLVGPVDSSGYAAFGGTIGSTTLTAAGTLTATAAAGQYNYTGSITNPQWTGLSTNGTMYLYLDITSAGVVTTGSTTLVQNYQWGGTYSVTLNQYTFNIQEMTMKVGNGSSAVTVTRVFVGRVTVAAGVVSAIVWYALKRRYLSPLTALPTAGTPLSLNHNIGIPPQFLNWNLYGQCTSAVGGYSVGDVVMDIFTVTSGTSLNGRDIRQLLTNESSQIASDTAYIITTKTGGAAAAISGANFSTYSNISATW